MSGNPKRIFGVDGESSQERGELIDGLLDAVLEEMPAGGARVGDGALGEERPDVAGAAVLAVRHLRSSDGVFDRAVVERTELGFERSGALDLEDETHQP